MAEYNIKNIRKEFKSKGIFYTQPELAEYMKSLIDIDIVDVYDPTCGNGALLSVFSEDLPKFGQEINDHQLEIAKSKLKNFTGVCADTLKDPAFMDKRFSCIVANPPFSIAWEPPQQGLFGDVRFNNAPVLPPKSKADYAFLLHIIHLLADDGIAIVLNFPGILYRRNREGILRKWFVDNNWIEKVIQIPGKTFIDTTIATSLLILKKNKTTTNIEFIDNDLNLSKVVPVDEIINNDYNLSVNSYVQKEVEKVIVDPNDLQQKARLGMCKRLRKDIEADKMICELEGWDFNAYLDDLKNVINSYYTFEV